jgi:hypothetical protein
MHTEIELDDKPVKSSKYLHSSKLSRSEHFLPKAPSAARKVTYVPKQALIGSI